MRSINESSDTRALALAAFWQSQLDVLCATCEFFAGYDPSDAPCALLALDPFAPGGLARLCLNVHSTIIQQAALELSRGAEDAVRRLGCMVVHTASWPIPQLDTPVNVHWKTARGLIGTPSELYVWPVPYQLHQRQLKRRQQQHNSPKPIHTPLKIWPRRICKVQQEIQRGSTAIGASTGSSTSETNAPQAPEYHLRYAGQVWKLRDEALRLEFQYLLEQEKGPSLHQRILSCFQPATRKLPQKSEDDTMVMLDSTSALLTYAPSLPVFAVAQYLIFNKTNNQRVPRHAALAEAAHWLVRNDRLFALSLFFGVPLIDRTQTLPSCLRCAVAVRSTPTRAQVEEFCQRFDLPTDATTAADASTMSTVPSRTNATKAMQEVCRATLRTLLLQRAESLWQMTESTQENNRRISGCVYVAWSGGIDSTAVLVAMLMQAQARPQHERRSRLVVLLDDESIVESPNFYQKFIQDNKLQTLFRNDKPLSWHEHCIRSTHPAARNILVTGELGDQLFGSDRCKAAFPTETTVVELPAHLANDAPAPPPPEYQGVFAERGLHGPWQDTVLPSLASVGLIAEGGVARWKEWIAPQLAAAPLPIVSTYDFLWWLNFSMKWQNVSLRFLHDGGAPLLENGISYGMGSCVQHFFDDADLECWSCVPGFHPYKFPDLRDFTTYKEPLKHFIREYDGDDQYYLHKVKVASLCFGAPEEADSLVNAFHGALVELVAPPEHPLDPNSREKTKIDQSRLPRLLSIGPCGLLTPIIDDENHSLDQLLEPHILSALRRYPSDLVESIHVDPWAESLLPTSPFNLAPFFADDDERQRRVFNPVSKITLTGKCATLLTRQLLNQRSFLDLGACLGASTHWALCMGASFATAVEVQRSFCERGTEMLRRAQCLDCWPSVAQDKFGRPPFQFVCSGVREYLEQCRDASHDVVLAAGLLHCFVDPIRILLELARVASHAVLVEMTHPNAYLDGHLMDPDESPSDDELLLGNLSSSVRPLKRRVEEGGLLQVAPRALINMAGGDSSFTGLGVLPSRTAIESLMKAHGFSVRRMYLKEHPTMNEDVLTYTGPRKYRALSTRYFLQCVRTKTFGQAPACSLESLVLANDQSRTSSWSKAESWYSFESERTDPAKTIAGNADATKDSPLHVLNSTTIDPPKDDSSNVWTFDASVAKRFQREARCHIPDYEDVIASAIELLEQDLAARSFDKRYVKVVDVGCATGHTLIRLLEHDFRNVHGVDCSSAMIEKAKEKLSHTEEYIRVGLHVNHNPLELPPSLCGNRGALLDAVFVNWTLQFVVQADDRKAFLSNISSNMAPGSLLVLTEKTTQNELTKKAYYDFKRSNGVSEREIAVKEARLKGVLEPFDVAWYLDALNECSFTEVSLFHARYGFVTFLARRGRKTTESPCCSVAPPAPSPTDPFQTWRNFPDCSRQVHYETKQESAEFKMCAWSEGDTESKAFSTSWSGNVEGKSVYGYVYSGPSSLVLCNNGVKGDSSDVTRRCFTLHSGMYFACSGCRINISGGSGVLHFVSSHQAMFAIGGPVEDGHGRLSYIDGCTDSLLLAPAVKGAPCLNHLHFPAGVVQTQHTHPSGRSGVVIRGKGTCVCGTDGVRQPLEPGTAFVIPTNVVHAFETTNDEELDVIAFHPDSDFGPSADNHPMINRTMVEGVSASKIESIQTRPP